MVEILFIIDMSDIGIAYGWWNSISFVREKSFMHRLHAKTMLDATPPTGKINL